MGKFKDKHGKSFIGTILGKVPQIGGDVIEIAGELMGSKQLVKLGQALDGDSAVSEEDKKDIMALAQLEMEYNIIEAQEVSKRWEVDAKSDSWLARNVRPLIVGWLVFFVTGIIIIDSVDTIKFKVSDPYVALLGSLLTTVIVAYFGSRGFEKFTKTRAKWKMNKQ